jgi:hypothetical protein
MWLNSGASEGYSIPLTESSLFAPKYLYKTNWGECGGLLSSFFFFFAFCIVDFGRETSDYSYALLLNSAKNIFGK